MIRKMRRLPNKKYFIRNTRRYFPRKVRDVKERSWKIVLKKYLSLLSRTPSGHPGTILSTEVLLSLSVFLLDPQLPLGGGAPLGTYVLRALQTYFMNSLNVLFFKFINRLPRPMKFSMIYVAVPFTWYVGIRCIPFFTEFEMKYYIQRCLAATCFSYSSKNLLTRNTTKLLVSLFCLCSHMQSSTNLRGIVCFFTGFEWMEYLIIILRAFLLLLHDYIVIVMDPKLGHVFYHKQQRKIFFAFFLYYLFKYFFFTSRFFNFPRF